MATGPISFEANEPEVFCRILELEAQEAKVGYDGYV